MIKLLTNMQRYRLEHHEKLQELNIQQRAAFYRDVKKKALLALDDLLFIAQHLPEKQLEKIFNKENLLPLFQAVFDLNRNMEKKVFEKRRQRILRIWDQIFNTYLLNITYALTVAGKDITFATQEIHRLSAAQAIYFASQK